MKTTHKIDFTEEIEEFFIDCVEDELQWETIGDGFGNRHIEVVCTSAQLFQLGVDFRSQIQSEQD